MLKILKILDCLVLGFSGFVLLGFTTGENPLKFPALHLVLPQIKHLVGFIILLSGLRLSLSFEKATTRFVAFAHAFHHHQITAGLLAKDIYFIMGLRVLLLGYYFGTEGFFLYQWDDQPGYFEVAQGLSQLRPIYERFTFGFPALLVPFIKIFTPQTYQQLVFPFSIFNAFVLGPLGIYWLFRITLLLTRNVTVARVAAVVYVIHPFLLYFAKTQRNEYLRVPITFGDIVGWCMSSDHVGVVFLLLAVFLFVRALETGQTLFFAGLALGYVGLIRIPNLLLLVPLCYLALLYKRKINDAVVSGLAIFLVLTPQFWYNQYSFGSPLRFGYTAIRGHINHYWTFDIFRQGQTLATVVSDHYLLLVFFCCALLIRPNRRIGGTLLLWVFVFAGYYAGYEQFYNDPIRFLLPLRPALCIGLATLCLSGQNRAERWFVCGSLGLLAAFTSYSDRLIPFDGISAAVWLLCLTLTLIGLALKLRTAAILPLYVYSGLYLYLEQFGVVGSVVFASGLLLLNLSGSTWGELAAILARLDGRFSCAPLRFAFTRFSVKIDQIIGKIAVGATTLRVAILAWKPYWKAGLSGLILLVSSTFAIPRLQSSWGLPGRYYLNPNWEGAPAASQIDQNLFLKGRCGENFLAAAVFSVAWQGWLATPASGTYRFTTVSDDGSFLRIAGQTVVNNGGMHGLTRVSGQITLKKGNYPIEVQYFQIGGFSFMQTLWTPPKQPEQAIAPEYFFAKQPQRWAMLFRKSVLSLGKLTLIAWWLLFGVLSLAVLSRSTNCARKD